MSVMHDCLNGTDDLYNPLLLGVVNGVVNDVEDPAGECDGFCFRCVVKTAP